MVLTREDFRESFPGQGDLIEFKQGISTEKIQEPVVAFSNADGGVILVGVDPQGHVRGRELDGELTKQLHTIVGGVHGPGRYELFDVLVDDRRVTVVGVARRHEGVAQTSRGVPLVRRGAMNVPLTGNDLERLVSTRRLHQFERTSTSVGFESASSGLARSVADAWSWGSETDLMERLCEKGLVGRGRERMLTVAGALYLLDEPRIAIGKAFIEIFRYPSGSAEYDRRVAVVGPAHEQVRDATRVVMDELGAEIVVLGVNRHEMPRLPEPVVREAIANAVAHRSYEIQGSAIRIEIRPDAVTIESPGGLPEPVTVENIRDQNAARNVQVIDTLRRFGLAEDAGRGIDVILDTMQEQLLDPPEFTDTGSAVRVRLPLGGTVTPRERAWVAEAETRGAIRPDDRMLLVHAARGELLSNQYVRELTGVDSVDARTALRRLRDAGFLEQSGSRRGVRYRLARGLSPPAGLRLSPDDLGNLVVGMAADGPVTNTLVRERTGLARARALALLSALVNEGRLNLVGERRGAHYVLPAEPPLDLS